MYACSCNNVQYDLVVILLESGADPSACDHALIISLFKTLETFMAQPPSIMLWFLQIISLLMYYSSIIQATLE